MAIAIGTGAVAHADGLFGSAFSVGTNAKASTSDAFTFAMAVGDGSSASAKGAFGLAAQLGAGDADTLGFGGLGNIGANIAIGVTPGTTGVPGTSAAGFGNIAINLSATRAGCSPTKSLRRASAMSPRTSKGATTKSSRAC